MRALLVFCGSLFGLGLFTNTAHASQPYPGVVASQWRVAVPPCKVCHLTDQGGTGTARQKFGLTAYNLGLRGSNPAKLRSVLDTIKAQAIDSDGDGSSDYDELDLGFNPNDPRDSPSRPEPEPEPDPGPQKEPDDPRAEPETGPQTGASGAGGGGGGAHDPGQPVNTGSAAEGGTSSSLGTAEPSAGEAGATTSCVTETIYASPSYGCSFEGLRDGRALHRQSIAWIAALSLAFRRTRRRLQRR